MLTCYLDDLPVIRDNIKKGFLETQSKVNSWVATLRKKIDGDDDQDIQGRPVQTTSSYDTRPSPQVYGSRRSGDLERRSVDRDRYDADPQVLGDDFAGLQMRDHEGRLKRIPYTVLKLTCHRSAKAIDQALGESRPIQTYPPSPTIREWTSSVIPRRPPRRN